MLRTLIVCSVLCAFCSFSQTEITGVAQDEVDSLLLGNVLLLSPSDSSLIRGAHFDFGVFSITHESSEPVLLKMTSFGFRDYYVSIRSDQLGQKIDLGTIKMQQITNDLGAVEVTASVPLFDKGPEGGLLVNVQKTVLASSTSVLEVLSKSPNVLVDGSTISVVGRGEALLYRNGKRISVEQLGAISVQSVDKIEIISNPSAKYDAEGRAVINIIMVVNNAEGFEVSLIQNFIFARHFLWGPAAGINYRKGKFSVNANYSVTLGKDWNEGQYGRDIITSSGLFSNEHSHKENTRLTYVGNHSLGVAYQLNDKHSVSAEYSGLYNVFDLDVEGDNNVTSPTNDATRLRTRNKGNTTNVNNAGSLNYTGIIDTLGSTIFVGTQVSLFNNQLNDLIDETIYSNDQLVSSATRNNVGFNDISIITGRVDIAKKMRNEMSFEYGAKYGDVSNRSKIDLYSRTGGSDFTLIPGYSNDFEYRERIPAAYLQWKGSLSKKANYSIGLRSEYSMIKGVSNTLSQTVLDTTYFNVFPNATLSFAPSDNWNYSLTYTSRISRPKYQDLDPFLWYQDSLTSIQGNPFLLPELVQGGEAAVQYKTYSFKMGYNHSVNPSRMVIWPGSTGDGSVLMRRSNLQAKHSAYASVSVPFKVKKVWSSFNTVSLTYDRYQDSRPEFQIGNITPQLYAYSYNRIKVKKWFNIELIFDYEGTRDDGIYRDEARYSLSAGLSKFMMRGDLQLRFLANDVLQTYREKGSVTIGQVSSNYDRQLNTNFYRFSVTYYFGKLRQVKYKNQSTGAEEFDRIKK